MVEVPVCVAGTWTVVGLAVTLKSWTVKGTVTECESEPLVPVTETMYDPATPEQESVEVPEPPLTDAGVNVQVSPVLGETVSVSATVPVKELRGAIVIVDMPLAPAFTVTLVGLAVIVKSGPGVTVKVTVAVCDSDALVPVTVTV